MTRVSRLRHTAALLFAACLTVSACTGSERASERDGHSGEPVSARSYDAKQEFVRSELRMTSAYPFANTTAAAGLYEKPTRSWGSAWSDYDVDGDPDLFVGRHGAPPHLYRNDGMTFSLLELPKDFYPESIDRHGCAWGEANGDGAPDLYCTKGVLRVKQGGGLQHKQTEAAGGGNGPDTNQLLVQSSSSFRDVAVEYGVADSHGRGRTINWLDYDSDGDLDIFVGNKGLNAPDSALFRNDGDGFTRVDVGLGGPHSVISSSWADWDVDGDPDLLIVQYEPSPTVAYENRGGRFVSVSIPHVTGQVWSSGAWGDFDNDGRPDLHLVGRSRTAVVRNTPSGFVVEHSSSAVAGRTSAWLDVENDGDLDVFVLQGAKGSDPSPEDANEPDFLLVRKGERFVKLGERSLVGPTIGNADSVSAADYDGDGRVDLFITNAYAHYKGPKILYRNLIEGGDWVGVDLDGDEANPLGIGAHVIVRAGERTVHRFVTDGVAFRQQNEVGYVSVGLGQAESAAIEVLWPDGSEDCADGDVGSVITISQGSSPCTAEHG